MFISYCSFLVNPIQYKCYEIDYHKIGYDYDRCLDHYTDDYIRVCKDNQIEPFFSVSLYIDNRNIDKNGCNYNCPAEIGEVCGRLIIFAQILKAR